MFDTVLINGSVGTGKTTTAERLGDELDHRGIPGSVIDVDWLRRSSPAPADDPFQAALALENLRAVASNFRRHRARVLVVATVVETLDELARHTAALESENLLHVRLVAAPEVVLSRPASRTPTTRRSDEPTSAVPRRRGPTTPRGRRGRPGRSPSAHPSSGGCR